VLWWINRLCDGLDGVVARITDKQTDFGGYLDIVCDFIVYAAIPIGLAASEPNNTRWLVVGLLEGIYFVNSVALFYLASILEKQNLGAATKGEKTTITMPPAFIEGTETMFFYGLFLTFPAYMTISFSVFFTFVSLTICQRLYWAYNNLDKNKKN